jgi:hypothetical protein
VSVRARNSGGPNGSVCHQSKKAHHRRAGDQRGIWRRAEWGASLIGRQGQALSDYPPLQCRCRSRARASLRNRHHDRQRKAPPSRGMKLVANRRSTDPKRFIARRMPRLEIRPSGRTPRVLFHLQRDGGGWSSTGPAHVPFPKSSIGGPAPIFWPNFLGKNLEIKIVFLASPRRGCYASAVLTAPDRTTIFLVGS